MTMPPESTHGARAKAKIQPTILIFDSKPQPAQRRGSRAKRPRSAAFAPSFAFIHVSQDDKENEDDRRLIKTHAMQYVLSKKQRVTGKLEPLSEYSALDNEQPEDIYAPGSAETTGSAGSSPHAPPSNLITFPIQTQPYMLRLIHNCT